MGSEVSRSALITDLRERRSFYLDYLSFHPPQVSSFIVKIELCASMLAIILILIIKLPFK